MDKYKKMQAIKFKYSNLLILDKITRSIYRIQAFAKKYVLYEPVNIAKDEVEKIPGLYRFRTKVYDTTNEYIIEDTYKSYEDEAKKTISDNTILEIRLKELSEEKNKLLIVSKINIKKIPIVLNIELFGIDPFAPIMIGDDVYFLSGSERKRIFELYDIFVQSESSRERYKQMLQWSKVLCEMYNNSLIKK